VRSTNHVYLLKKHAKSAFERGMVSNLDLETNFLQYEGVLNRAVSLYFGLKNTKFFIAYTPAFCDKNYICGIKFSICQF